MDGWVVYATDMETNNTYVSGIYETESYAHYWSVMDSIADREYGYGNFERKVKYEKEVTEDMWKSSYEFGKLKLDNYEKNRLK